MKMKKLNGDQVTFDYSATVDGNKFEGSEGKGVN
jgi:FKBP-type peptidyl-prolyl cis-trans isomerase (trigger factor)